MTVKMHHGNDHNLVALNSVNDSVGKAVCPATSNLFVQRDPCCGMHDNTPDGGTDFLKEIKSKTRNALFLKFRRLPQFPSRWQRKPELHCFNSSSMARKASSPSMAVSWPVRKAAKRSWDSSSQARSTEYCSAESRLRQSASIICARSMGGSFKASFARIALSILSL